MHVTFDTLAMVQRLEAKGFTSEQAKEVVSVVRDVQAELATKEYLDSAMDRLEERFSKDMEITRKDIIIKIGIMIATSVGILGALIKFF